VIVIGRTLVALIPRDLALVRAPVDVDELLLAVIAEADRRIQLPREAAYLLHIDAADAQVERVSAVMLRGARGAAVGAMRGHDLEHVTAVAVAELGEHLQQAGIRRQLVAGALAAEEMGDALDVGLRHHAVVAEEELLGLARVDVEEGDLDPRQILERDLRERRVGQRLDGQVGSETGRRNHGIDG
jgi:hypothetical protein